jgi:RimJ/RimL family protein N-acetyltransferase
MLNEPTTIISARYTTLQLASAPSIGGITDRMQDLESRSMSTATDKSDSKFAGLRSFFRRGSADDEAALETPDPPAIGELVRAGERVQLRRHVAGNRAAFQRWYADPEIAYLLRHDLTPLSERQSRGYFDTVILPLSLQGYCFAIHTNDAGELIGTTALTDAGPEHPNAALFRIVIGEKWAWEQGFGTEATSLVVDQAFEELGLDEVQLEVFRHNPRAISAYRKVGFQRTGAHTEYIPPNGDPLHVVEMAIRRLSDPEITADTD